MANGARFEIDGSIATITLDRPEVGNALDIPMSRELMDLAIRCEGDSAIRCVVLTGAGKLFCGGGDVAGFSAAGDQLPEHLREITSYLHSAIAVFAPPPHAVAPATTHHQRDQRNRNQQVPEPDRVAAIGQHRHQDEREEHPETQHAPEEDEVPHAELLQGCPSAEETIV